MSWSAAASCALAFGCALTVGVGSGQAQDAQAAEPELAPAVLELPPPPPPPPPPSAAPAAAESDALATPETSTELAPDGNPYVPAHGPRRPWTHADIIRLRAQLAAARAGAHHAPFSHTRRPRVYGDAGAANMLGVEFNLLRRDDVGYEHFRDGDRALRIGLFAVRDVVTIAPKVIGSIEVGVGFEQDRAPGLLGSSGGADLDSQTYYGAFSVRWDAVPFLSPHVRAAAGASLFQFDLPGRSDTFETDHEVSGFGSLGLGLLLHTPPRLFESRSGKFSSFGLGILIEGGYALRSPVDFALHAKGDSRRIAVVDAELGRLDLSGPYLRICLVTRF